MITNHKYRINAAFIGMMVLFVLACTMFEPVPTPTSVPQQNDVVVASPPAVSFAGSWTSIDSDGSNQELIISAASAGAYNVSFTDFGASACGKDSANKPIYAATATGNLTASGNYLSGSLPIYCQKTTASLLADYNFQFTLDPASGTLRDGLGITWYRK